MIQNGIYTLVYGNGEYRTLRIESKLMNPTDTQEKTILSRKSGKSSAALGKYEGIAFLSSDNRVMLWKRFRAEFDQTRLNRLQDAVNRIARNPKEAGMAYAIHEGCCCRCGRELTVPASIHAGMGPDCAEKYAWEKQDQVAVHDHVAAVRTPDSPYADAKGTTSAPKPVAKVAAPAPVKNAGDVVARMVSFQRTMETEKFYDPFGIGDKLTDAAAVNFWTKRFTANQIEDDRFWGDEAGRQEMIDEQAAELASLKAEEAMNERRFQAVYGNEPSESF
jgi:uncharacterized protein DUF6011